MPVVLTALPEDAVALRRGLHRPILVIGLCAAWCGTCREFESTFDHLAAKVPDSQFVWLDVEDDSAIAGDIDVENFPSLAVFRDGAPVYFGVSLPQEGVVARLLAALVEGPARPVSVPEEVAELPALLAQHVEKLVNAD